MNNKQKYWFKRRRYGYGWFPTTKESWMVIVAFIISLLIASKFLLKEEGANFPFVFVLISLVGILVFISHKKGPKPKWRWGKKPGDDPELDF